MSKFWPIVMWFEDVEGDAFRYSPSYAHHRSTELPSFDRYEDALRHAYGMCGKQSSAAAITMFRPYVIECDHKPDLLTKGAVVMRATRFAVNEDGIIAPNVGHTQETADAA